MLHPMIGLPLLHVRQGEQYSRTRQPYVPGGYRTRDLFIAKRISYPFQYHSRY